MPQSRRDPHESQKTIDYRPQTNYLDTESVIAPDVIFQQAIPLNPSKIDKLVEQQEDKNLCRDLAKTLEMHTTPDLSKQRAYTLQHKQSLKQRRNTVETLKNPDFVPESKFVNGSKVVQLAYLDKIIEDCTDQHSKSNAGELNQNLK